MSGAEITVTNKRGYGINLARGRAGNLASALGYDREKQLSAAEKNDVFVTVLASWVALANQRLKPGQAAKYQQGIVRENVARNPDQVEWALAGFDAISLEFGWAPPTGKGLHRSDGIGEWDGAVHDMRSYMLTDGNPGLKVTQPDEKGRGGGKKYMLVPFHENATSFNLSKKIDAPDTFREALSKLGVGGILSEEATQDMDVASRQILSRKFIGPLYRKGGHIVPPPEEAGKEQRLTGRHGYSKYRKIIRNYADASSAGSLEADRAQNKERIATNAKQWESARGVFELHKAKRTKGSGRAVGFRFTMIRTITEDMGKGMRTWMTTGYPPADLLREVRDMAAKAITNVLAGRAAADSGGP